MAGSCLAALGVALGCTTTTVRPLGPVVEMTHVCIEKNERVLVNDFVPVVRDGLSRHGLSSEVFSEQPPENCEYILTYTALRSWDLSPYLSHAEIRIEHGGRQIGYGEYHLRGKGGYSLYKYQGTKAKMGPVLDELLGGIHD